MLSHFQSFLVLAQSGQTPTPDESNNGFLSFVIFACLIIAIALTFAVGNLIARSLRMSDYGWKIGVILLTMLGGTVVCIFGWPPKLGIDLSGGVILVYEVSDEEKEVDMSALIAALTRRINPSGVKEIVVRQYGDRQVEIIIPEVETSEINYLKSLLTKTGVLKFRILADRSSGVDDPLLFELAQRQNEAALAKGLTPSREVRDGAELIGEWVNLALDHEKSTEETPVYKVDVSDQQNMTRELRPGRKEVLMRVTRFNVKGEDLKSAIAGHDDVGRPAVHFSMTGPGAAKFGGLTSTNLNRRLGIVMDNELLSAPNIEQTITSNGIIHGRFTEEEVNLLVGVLKAGKLPTALKKDPISDNEVSSLLGSDTVQKGKFAISISVLAVLVFMVVYYRFPGIVACFALALNLVLILAVMILFKAALTLPGLAGLVLTVGMSVDANVLIFERIREELNRGAALRMAIRNGFGRATTTIVDANVTTLITATVLYVIGTDQIRGFAVTLWLGIVMSMFSAIFCSRVVFDIAERKRWITKLNMIRLFGQLNIDFIGKRRIGAACSIALIVVGLCGAVYRGKNLFDIDFNGGTSVNVMLTQAMPIEDVRKIMLANLADYDPSVIEVQIEGRPKNTIYKIDTAITGEIDLENRNRVVGADISGLTLVEREIRQALNDRVEQVDFKSRNSDTGEITADLTLSSAMTIEELREALRSHIGSFHPIVDQLEDTDQQTSTSFELKLTLSGVAILQDQLMKVFSGKLAKRSVDFTAPVQVSRVDAAEFSGEPSVANSNSDETSATESVESEQSATGVDNQERSSEVNDPRAARVRPPRPAADAAPPALADSDGSPASADSDEPSDVQPSDHAFGTNFDIDRRALTVSESTLTFASPVNRSTVDSWISSAAARVGMSSVTIEDASASDDRRTWKIKLGAEMSQMETILADLKASINEMPVWLSSNKIGGKVAGKTRNDAIAAILASFVFIVIYIWVRFQRVFFGLAAVAALLHDILITLGFLALSFWLAQAFGFLFITEFKINLPIVAAFLTIIGYSLNDTIVVFDRIREVRGKSPDVTAPMVNKSINQTLSRTVLTSLTTLLVVMILYVAGGESIHGFAFALVVGVLVGTYSSMFVAAPVLLWMTRSSAPAQKQRKPVSVG